MFAVRMFCLNFAITPTVTASVRAIFTKTTTIKG